jgi:hypothetical protein
VPDSGIDLERICSHCGAFDQRHIGHCDVCGLAVCERCGNMQHTRTGRRARHNGCLDADQGAGFTMIRIIK